MKTIRQLTQCITIIHPNFAQGDEVAVSVAASAAEHGASERERTLR